MLASLGLACLFNGGWIFEALVLLAMIGVGHEWAGITAAPRLSGTRLMLLTWPVLCLLATGWFGWLAALRLLLCGLLLGPRHGSGVVLTGLAGFALVWLRRMTGAGPACLLFVMLAVWASDSFAYLAGRAFGGAKLAPRISPAKTWSGALGGLLGATLAGAGVCLLDPAPGGDGLARLARGAAFGALLGCAAQAGDLAESAFKRRQGVKDSGSLIPGHGGLLDRLDGLIAAAPLAALLSLGSGIGHGFWQLDPFDPRPVDLAARHMTPGWLEGMIAKVGKS